jgi:hypothetical protein
VILNKIGVLSIISGQGVFGVRTHAKNTRLPRFIEMILKLILNKKRHHFEKMPLIIDWLFKLSQEKG